MNRRLWLLLIVHVVSGLFLGFAALRIDVLDLVPFLSSLEKVLSRLEMQCVLAVALLHCQSCLLAFWAAMSQSPLWKRLLGLCGGTGYLWVFAKLARTGFSLFDGLSISTVPTVIVAVVLLVFRFSKVELRRDADDATYGDRHGLQFSIRGLMLLTFAVALLTAAATGLRNVGPAYDYVRDQSAFSVCFVVVGLASPWATLRTGLPITSTVAVPIVSLLLRWSITYGQIETTAERHFDYGITLLHALTLLASLLVVRSCGYRLVKRDRNAVAAVSSQTTPSPDTGTDRP
jgi:hypothetical protein